MTNKLKKDALIWWKSLTKSQQKSLEIRVFGYGEFWEDNSSLSTEDIVTMYKQKVNW